MPSIGCSAVVVLSGHQRSVRNVTFTEKRRTEALPATLTVFGFQYLKFKQNYKLIKRGSWSDSFF